MVTSPPNVTLGVVEPVVELDVAVMASAVPISVWDVAPLCIVDPLPYQTEKL